MFKAPFLTLAALSLIAAQALAYTRSDLETLVTNALDCNPGQGAGGKPPVFVWGGEPDNFAGGNSEPTAFSTAPLPATPNSPSLTLATFAPTVDYQRHHRYTTMSRDYDETHANEYFQEQLDFNAIADPSKFRDAILITRYRQTSSLSSNDNTYVGSADGFILDANGNPAGSGTHATRTNLYAKRVNELVSSGVWTENGDDIWAHLSDLTSTTSGTAMDALKADGMVSIIVQDDTYFDYIMVGACENPGQGNGKGG